MSANCVLPATNSRNEPFVLTFAKGCHLKTFAVLRSQINIGLQPIDRIIWLGLDFLPAHTNAFQIDSKAIPSKKECAAVAGLDVIVLYHGHSTRYGSLRTLSENLYQAIPRRLQLIDFDLNRVAYLKL